MWMYDLYYNGGFIHEGYGFDSRLEAIEDAEAEKEERILYWKRDGAWNPSTDDASMFECIFRRED